MRSNADGIAADDPLDSADADDSVRAPSSLAARTTRRVRRVRTVVRINRGDDRAARDGAPMVAVIASTVVATRARGCANLGTATAWRRVARAHDKKQNPSHCVLTRPKALAEGPSPSRSRARSVSLRRATSAPAPPVRDRTTKHVPYVISKGG